MVYIEQVSLIVPMECDWNQRYLNNDAPWDKGAPAPALEEVFENGVFTKGSKVLVPGCGYGHDVRAISATGCLATGLDISECAVLAAQTMTDEGASEFFHGDFFDPSLAGKNRYHAIWEHTCFCAIFPEERDDYVEAAYRLLQPGGVLVGVFFAFGKDEEGPPFKTNRETLLGHFGRRFTLEWEQKPERYFPTREGIEWLMCWRRNDTA